MIANNNPTPRSRGIYILPNLFTTASLFAGFFAIVAALHQHFDTAAIAILIAMLMDFLDGRVARLTNTQSEFGKEYDSLTDMVSFGITPALVIYKYALDALGTFGWLIAFIYSASVALRLARFNTQVKKIDKRYFQGLSSTSGAGVIASLVWFCGNHPHSSLVFDGAIAVITFFVAALMVSNIRYNSFKDIDLRKRIPFVTLLIIVLVFVGVAVDPPTVFLIIFASYMLSGPILTLIRLRKTRQERKQLRAKAISLQEDIHNKNK